jgi:hypothetical protein
MTWIFWWSCAEKPYTATLQQIAGSGESIVTGMDYPSIKASFILPVLD